MVSGLGHLMGSLAVRALGQVSRALNRAGGAWLWLAPRVEALLGSPLPLLHDCSWGAGLHLQDGISPHHKAVPSAVQAL